MDRCQHTKNEKNAYAQASQGVNDCKLCWYVENERLRGRVEKLEKEVSDLVQDEHTLVLMAAQSIDTNVIKILNDWVKNRYDQSDTQETPE